MPTIPQSDLPRPKSWDEFEDIVWDLYTRAWKDPNAQRYGRSGQAQQGVDIYGQPSHLGGGYAGVQCKRYEPGKLTQSVIEAETAKAEAFVPPLAEYTIATTHPRDATVQRIVRDLNKERTKKGQVPVHILFWEDICSRLSHPDNRDLLQKHYRDWLPAGFAAHPTLTAEECRELERAYLNRVADECRYLYTEGVDRVCAELTDVFVMLEAVQSSGPEKRTDVAPVPVRAKEIGAPKLLTGQIPREEKQAEQLEPLPPPPPPPVPLSKALAEHKRLVILGEPGTGKSTTLQFLALCFARSEEGWPRQSLDLDEDRAPVRVELRQYDGQERLDRFLVRWLDTQYYVPEALAQQWLDEGRLAILLDGLDEVPHELRSNVICALEGFAATAEGNACRIVVSSRIAGYQRTRELQGNFGHYTICPFAGSEEALTYTAGWLQLFRGTTNKEAEAEARNLLEKIDAQAGLRRVRGNPLLLRLAVAIYAESGELARNRAEVYRHYVDEVVWRRAEAREQPRWSRETIESAVEAVAWTLQIDGEQTKAGLAKTTTKSVEGLADARHLIDYLQEQLGLLAAYGYEQGAMLAFRHLTFREYFVARRLAQEWDKDLKRTWGFLHPRLHHPTWRESILLLAGIVGEAGIIELVERVLAARSPFEPELGRDLLLAGECLAVTGAQAPPALRHSLLDKLIAVYLRELGRHIEISESSKRLFVRPIEMMFDSFGEADRAYILVSLLALAEGSKGTERYISTRVRVDGVREASTRDYQRCMAIRALGTLKLGVPEVTSLLLRALGDGATRYSAAEALSRRGPWTTEAASCLASAYQKEESLRGRARVTVNPIIEALGVVAQRDPKVVEYLVGLAHNKANSEGVRYAAVCALCKAAETNVKATAFVLEEWQEQRAQQPAYGGQSTEPVDQEIHRGLDVGKQMIVSVSPDVAQYLLKVSQSDPRMETGTAGYFLAQVAGATPLLQCKSLGTDAQFTYTTLDLTDYVFDIVLHRPTCEEGVNIGFYLLARWGFRDADLLTEFISTVRKADAWFLAWNLERLTHEHELAPLTLPEDLVAFADRSIPCLRSPEEAERLGSLSEWERFLQGDRGDLWRFNCLWDAVEHTKLQVLSSLYNTACQAIDTALADSWSDQNLKEINPFTLPALKCFEARDFSGGSQAWPPASRGLCLRLRVADHREWNFSKSLSSLSLSQVKQLLSAEIAHSLRILQGCSKCALEMLDPCSVVDSMALVLSHLDKSLAGPPLDPPWTSSTAEPSALAVLSIHCEEAQAVLLSFLRSYWKAVDENVILALGYVGRAHHEMVSILLDMVISQDSRRGSAASIVLGRLRNPLPETVLLLRQVYPNLPVWARYEVLCLLGTAERPSQKVLDLLLGALEAKDERERSTAARALGNLQEPTHNVMNTVLAHVRTSAAAADAIGKLLTRFSDPDDGEVHAWLTKAAALIRRHLRQGVPRPNGRIWDCPSYVKEREALSIFVARLTELEVKALGDGTPLFTTSSPGIRTSPTFLAASSVLVAAFSGLVSNILAAYLQEQYALLTDPARLVIVVAVFLLTLAGSIWIAWRLEKGAA